MDEIRAEYGETELELLVDFLRRAANTGHTATQQPSAGRTVELPPRRKEFADKCAPFQVNGDPCFYRLAPGRCNLPDEIRGTELAFADVDWDGRSHPDVGGARSGPDHEM
ncbi:hypothetical protein QMK19_04150 [Streptomyces sp. H10-C2]|uniref:hypothetical protein n=1 Tax=unclassified Streptomyces TaxID=2593676 RepID=UPI0024B94B3A|nr:MULTISPECIES: hypothetical protein [unclassified Streptomyces]MDJ0343529.1 hypothetical protein [Streptomyces sp. PH10-H1]MDJ0368895.1 hypothetical protein [Streptomyces sp. H10-C2]